MARDGVVPFNQRTDTGRMGFRNDWEQVDERPLLIYPHPFWTDIVEKATYEAAVAMNPRREGEGPISYIRRISEVVTQERQAGLKPMPKAGRVRL